MSDDQTRKPRFEPPPWEQEAFERFRADQEEQRKQDELDTALREAQEARVAAEAATNEPSPADPGSETALPVADQPADVTPAARPAISEARIDSMLIQLKGEEPPAAQTSFALINGVIGAFVLSGLYIIIQAALLFSKTRAEGASGMLGAVASLIVLLTGIGFVAGGFLLFRKHHV